MRMYKTNSYEDLSFVVYYLELPQKSSKYQREKEKKKEEEFFNVFP